MSSRKKKQQQTRGAGRPWEAVVGGFVAVAVVAGIFWMTNRSQEQPAEGFAEVPQQATSPLQRSVPAAAPQQIAAVDRITPEETKQLLDAGKAITIDVRDVESYVAGHIPGALQIPLQYVPGEIPWFPRDKKIITYCT